MILTAFNELDEFFPFLHYIIIKFNLGVIRVQFLLTILHLFPHFTLYTWCCIPTALLTPNPTFLLATTLPRGRQLNIRLLRNFRLALRQMDNIHLLTHVIIVIIKGISTHSSLLFMSIFSGIHLQVRITNLTRNHHQCIHIVYKVKY